MKKLALAVLAAIVLTVSVAQAQAPALTMQAVAYAIAKMGMTPGRTVTLSDGQSYKLKDIAIEQRPNGHFAVVFGADPI